MLASSSTRLVCFQVDGTKAVRTNIVAVEGRVSKGVNEGVTSTVMPLVRTRKLLMRAAALLTRVVRLLKWTLTLTSGTYHFYDKP